MKNGLRARRHDQHKPAVILCALAVTLSGLLIGLLALSPASSRADDEELIDIQLYNDMMYGLDDYFGENSDLFYSDPVIPSDPAATTTTDTMDDGGGGGADDDDDDDDDDSGSADPGGGTGTGDDPGGGDPPPDEGGPGDEGGGPGDEGGGP